MTPSEHENLISDIREQVLYLQELGVETFDVKLAERVVNPAAQMPPREIISNLRSEISKFQDTGPTQVEPRQKPQSRPAGSRLAELPSLSSLSKRNEPEPLPRIEAETSIVEKQTETLSVGIAPTLPEPTETIEQIRVEIGPDCTRCKLSQGRKQVVNSTGNFNAELMFVGEAPGADEDLKGEPFVGRAGQLLTDIIEKGMGLKRGDVFIGNINRCRPPENRAPVPEESAACKPFLFREIEVVKPKVIVVLGATAAQNLLETKVPIGKLRGQFHDYRGTKVMPTFHPAYLLRDPHKKREVWEDMKMVMNYLSTN